jgi:DNA-binding CsgD family transcriptional regulator
MPKIRVTAKQRQIVTGRAQHCCEYCYCPSRFATQSFSVEHIKPQSQGGKTTLDNLALACQGCNGHKYTKTEGYDPTAGEALIAAIRGTVEGKTYVDPAVVGKLFAQVAQNPAGPETTITVDLSEREREVLSLLARGLTNTDIARQLHLSEGTVRNYVSAVFTKLGVSDRTQAAVIALRHGLVD